MSSQSEDYLRETKRDPLETLADRLVRGERVDWSAERAARPHLEQEIRSLEAMYRMLESHSYGMPESPQSRPSRTSTTTIPSSSRIRPPAHVPERWGHLIVREKLGEGGFGSVYRAHDPALQIDVALKLWTIHDRDRDRADRLLWEARRLARVRHPNVLVVHGADERDGEIGMWTELVHGRTLEQQLEDDGPLGPLEAAALGLDLCRALAAVHAAGLVHRDVKTTNVMREQGGRIVLMDFGTVVELASDGWLSPDEEVVGTPVAMAPEQLLGGRVGLPADIYGLGILLYRMLTASYPIEAHTLATLLQEHANGRRVPLRDRRPDLPTSLVRAIETAIAVQPEDRYGSAGIMEKALLRFVEAPSQPHVALPHPTPSPRIVETAEGVARLPRVLSSFVGREAVLDRVLALLERTRLLTLVGPGGIGKTRIAIRAAELDAGRWPDGVWFVDLAPIIDGGNVAGAISAALKVLEQPRLTALESLIDWLRERQLLIVLDNCEHLQEAAVTVAHRLLVECPAVRLLATSRSALGLDGEQTLPIAPLEVPAGGPLVGSASQESEAVRLFVERASQVRFGFQLDDRNAATVAEIVRRLDGVPLAIELAAANARLLTPSEILERIDDRLRLVEAKGDRTPRHRTLRSVVQWSYDLLEEPERRLFRTLGIFQGGWTAESAGVVCCPGEDSYQVLERISALVDASLVAVEETESGGSRYRYLRLIGQFAAERLDEAPDAAEIRARHLEHFSAVGARAHAELWGSRAAEWLVLLDAEHENLVTAARWSSSRPEHVERGLELVAGLYRYWYTRGRYRLGLELVAELLARGAHCGAGARARASFAAAGFSLFLGDVAAARHWYGDALDVYRAIDDAFGIGRTLMGLGSLALREDDFELARTRYEESLSKFRDLGHRPSEFVALHNLVDVAQWRRDLESASTLEREALALARELGNPLHVATALANLGAIEARLGHRDSARAALREALEVLRDLGAQGVIVDALEGASLLALECRDAARSARWWSTALRARRESGLTGIPAARRFSEAHRERVREQLGTDAFRNASKAGEELSLVQAVEEVERWMDG